jgi:FkbM family methyltransferase
VNLYGQAAEIELLSRVMPKLDRKTAIDVGAERGTFTRAMLDAGAEAVHAIEPEARNLTCLREQFGQDPRVTIYDCAIGREDGRGELRLALDKAGAPLTFAHTLLERPNAAQVDWHSTIEVQVRSIGSLVTDGSLPSRVGILKVDTEGFDLAVVSGLGELECDVIMTEHWTDLPASLGPCPWTSEEMLTAVAGPGFEHFVCFVHRGELTIAQWDDARVPVGAHGNLVFVHNRVVETLALDVLLTSSALAVSSADAAEGLLARIEALERERVIQTNTADERLGAMRVLDDQRRSEASRVSEQRLKIEALDQVVSEQLLSIEELGKLVADQRRTIEILEKAREQPAASRTPYPLRKAHYELSRIRALAHPRLGRLRHYNAIPLTVPASYLEARPPSPAPSISIVTPAFQHGRFLERTLRSVLDQHYPGLEYFVEDGGSTDETTALLERYDNELAGWVSEPDEGQADAINRGFARTSGELMAWLNSDDLLLPGALAYVGSYFAAHPEVDVVYGHRVLIDDEDGQIGVWVLPPHDDYALGFADFVPQETLFWRRSIWEAVGGHLDETFAYALDWDLLLRFRDAGATMVRLPRFLGAFRMHDDQKTLAAHPTGLIEMARLRERSQGRPVSLAEVNAELRQYFRRHVVLHLRQRIRDRLPMARVTLSPRSPDPQATRAPSSTSS